MSVRLMSAHSGIPLSSWYPSQRTAVAQIAAALEGNPKVDGDRHLIIKVIDSMIITFCMG